MDSPFVSRETRQYLENSAWKDDLVDELFDMGILDNLDAADKIAEKLLYLNKDEGGDLMEISAGKFLRGYIREILEE